MKQKKTNPDFLTGIPEMLVLHLLLRNPMHGYGIVQAIRLRSDEKFKFGEGSIYPVLHRLESEGVLKTKRETVRGRERVVYSVTAKGKRRLADSKAWWQQVVDAVDTVFAEPQHE